MTAKIIDIKTYIKNRKQNKSNDSTVINDNKNHFSENDKEIFKSILEKASKLGW